MFIKPAPHQLQNVSEINLFTIYCIIVSRIYVAIIDRRTVIEANKYQV